MKSEFATTTRYAAGTPKALELRPDVRKLVDDLIRSAPRGRRVNPWVHYSFAKGQISRACGWDAPRERYDQLMYDAGVDAYLVGVKL